ncbi:MAG TPA: GntR family transcriptional regulator [Anaerolineaceae bacterium]|nr:GntR family transcriptional regulator [Anaerolineaceae bacterium]
MDKRTAELLNRIDFESNIPYYVQLIALIKENIHNGYWKSGDQLPGEPELCVASGISRTVVRQALRELELEGLITRRKGKGTFVAEPKISEGLVQKLTGFYQDMVERGFKPVTRVLHQRVVPASEKVAGYLEIEPGTEVVDIKRLRSVNDEPIQLVTTYIPYSLCPQLATVDLTERSLYEFLENECHIILARGRRYIEAVSANEYEAHLLGIERGAPLLLLDSVSYLADGKPVEYYHAVHRGDRSRFEVDLVGSRSQNGAKTGLETDLKPLSTESLHDHQS